MSARMISARRSALRSRVPRIALLSLTALLFCLPQAASASVTPKGVTGPIVSGDRSTKCVTDLANGTANNTPIVISDCTGGPEQNWTIEADGSIQINGKCLDIFRDRKANRTPVNLWACHGGPNQQFSHWALTGGTLVNARSGKCLDDPRFDTTNGTHLEIFTCNGGVNQQWQLP
jgi:hypothetical protein